MYRGHQIFSELFMRKSIPLAISCAIALSAPAVPTLAECANFWTNAQGQQVCFDGSFRPSSEPEFASQLVGIKGLYLRWRGTDFLILKGFVVNISDRPIHVSLLVVKFLRHGVNLHEETVAINKDLSPGQAGAINWTISGSDLSNASVSQIKIVPTKIVAEEN
ncbi:hypothetical protein DO97_03470 [Neosynechococcus sphagnicola sy1]|uniref:Uncharacterized protein n=1 Tax=Neosynechococcus sphagnicola sy1 TaxID=1497020 RepID=A0A098TKK4_9CYAN|nr:hypothetical protein DO97_03470 [Neosynechococcus sphagnicola sy1]